IQGVTKAFGDRVAVRDLSLVVPAGTVTGFIGPNGAGKTTTIRMIMSIFLPDRGAIRVLGADSAAASKDRIGYLPEERGVYRKMRVLPFLVYMGRLKGVPERVVRERAAGWLARVGLGDVARKKCEELSKGMQQKVQFIAAVQHEPDLLILDEPFSGLDPVNRRLLRELIQEQHERGRTIIFSTHAMLEAEQLCDHVLMIHQGRKVLDATRTQVRSRFDPHALLVEPADEADGARLGSVPGVVGVEPDPGARGGLVVRLAEGADVHEAMRRVVASVPVRRVEVKRVSLEDVFIELVGARPEGPLPGAAPGRSREEAALA
ncbi:MAG TPA: ATP-binding cassette domain-containing protein, partial [Phycisphaerales bacterium]|nr:ATP-binding cassette domain-containing protein [Phycisphaerales bacterium]